MLDPEIRKLVDAKVAADIPEHTGELRVEIGKAVAELAARGVLQSSITVGCMSDLCAGEIRRRASVVWQTLQEVLRAAKVQYGESLPSDLKEALAEALPERPADLLSLVRSHVQASGFPEMITEVESSIRSARALALGRLNAEIDIFALGLKQATRVDGSLQLELERDDLSGLYTKGVFNRRGPDLVEQAKESKLPLSLIIIDLDQFKGVNDKYGHPVGDEVLSLVAGILREAVISKGEGYRWGGDEFAAFLLNHSPEEAAAVAERVRQAVESTSPAQKDLKVTVSIGVGSLPDHAQGFEDLLKKADDALLEVKRLGRNLVRVSGESAHAPQGKREPKRREPEPGGLSDGTKDMIRRAYFKTRQALCPNDGAKLRVLEGKVTNGQRAIDILATCPLCGLEIDLPGDNG